MSNDGVYIPILEVEKFKIAKYGDGFRFHDSGRLHRDWNGTSVSGINAGKGTGYPRFLCAASSSGWLKINVISGSTFGPTGAAFYIPLFKTLDTKTST
jgi:hypothetical protein